MKLLVNDLKLYFGLLFLLPLTLAGHKLHPTLPAGSFFHLLVFLTLLWQFLFTPILCRLTGTALSKQLL